MKHMNNNYGQTRIFKLQMFAEGEAPEGEGGESTDQQDEKKYSDKDVDKIVKGKYAKWKAEMDKELKEKDEAAKKAQEEAAKLAKMNAEQKQQYEMDKIKSQNQELQAKLERIELGKAATNILKESNIEATDEILEFVVADNAENTKANIDKFVKIIEAQVQKAEVARATGTTPRTITNNGNQLSEIEKRIAKYS